MDTPELTIEKYTSDWNLMAKDILGVHLDERQQDILRAVQTCRRVSVRSGHSRGKDYVSAVAALCFLYSYYPSKVILTAPTGRQVVSIMMAEIGRIWRNARIPLGGELQTTRIKFPQDPDWYLEGFKASDKETEAWTGYHSPHILVVITEASGIEQETFDAIEGILTGTVSRLLIVGNPNRTTGEFYNSFRSKQYRPFILNCLDAPNVLAKSILIPGQVDYEWVREKVEKWCRSIAETEADPDRFDFRFDGRWYRPNDLFLIKVMAQFPREASDQLIPLDWVEAAVERYKGGQRKGEGPLRLGVDVAGMGRDYSVYAYRRGNVVQMCEVFANAGRSELIHMQNAGRIKNALAHGGRAFVDAIGEGAGVHSRLIEQGALSVAVKFSAAASDDFDRPLTDLTGERTFANMRAYCWWAVRDALDPKFGFGLSLPPVDELVEDLTAPRWEVKSNGRIILEKKEDVKKRLGRSPDWGDAVAQTFYPDIRDMEIEVEAGEER